MLSQIPVHRKGGWGRVAWPLPPHCEEEATHDANGH